MEENILKIPTKDQADNVLKPPSKEHEANVLKPPSKETPLLAKGNSAAKAVPDQAPVVKAADDDKILDEFVNGAKLGEDLKSWLDGLDYIPSVEKIIFHLLTKKEKLNPDVECGWAEPEKYGAALLSLVQDDVWKQADVLFGVQKYCDQLGMPKLDDEYVIQAMFRSMYKYDIAGDEAFAMWKEDESPEHEAGKLNAVIQTVDWFNWLEEDDDDDDDEEEEE
jgi:hypothetical protein